MSHASLAIAALATGAMFLPATALAAPLTPTTPGTAVLGAEATARAAQAVAAKLIDHRVVDDFTYGPVAIYTIHVHNTGTEPTKTLNVTLPDGSVFLDREGEQALIRCLDNFMPLPPGDQATCEAYRLLTDAELRAGNTDPIDLVVTAFGADGPKVGGLHAESLPTGELGRKLTFHLVGQDVADDSSYGPVENIHFQVTNAGRVPAGFELAVYNADGQSYLDQHGDVMRLYCTDGSFTELPAGESITCIAQRRLAESEIAAGTTDVQQLQFTGWGRNSQMIPGFTTAAITFDPAMFDKTEDDDEAHEAPVDTTPAPEKPAPSPANPTTASTPAPTRTIEHPALPLPDAEHFTAGGRLPVTGSPLALLGGLAGALAGGGLVVRNWTHRL